VTLPMYKNKSVFPLSSLMDGHRHFEEEYPTIIVVQIRLLGGYFNRQFPGGEVFLFKTLN